MNPEQKHALRVLHEILRPGSKIRGTALLGLTGPCEGYKPLPDNEFCQGWAFKVGTHFADALDISLQRRLRNKQPYYIWTQGSAFSFKPGYTLQKSSGETLVQVVEAKSAIPARTDEERDPGLVLVEFHQAGSRPGTWCKHGICHLSQDEFVRFLITGEEAGWSGPASG